MEYTIQQFSKLAGISSRTLRYYDEIGLLKPCRINSSGYRIYGQKEVNLLQQILLYRELELPLETIKEIIYDTHFDYKNALYTHKQNLLEKQKHLSNLLQSVENTIQSIEGGIPMADKDKFKAFKKKMIQDNEEKYGEELREKYGEDTITASYKKMANLSKEQWAEVENLSLQINEALKKAMEDGNPSSDLAKETVKLHSKWLHYFHTYPPQAHLGLGQMYVDDPRFADYYDKNVGPEAATFLRDAIAIYYNATFDENTWQWIVHD